MASTWAGRGGYIDFHTFYTAHGNVLIYLMSRFLSLTLSRRLLLLGVCTFGVEIPSFGHKFES